VRIRDSVMVFTTIIFFVTIATAQQIPPRSDSTTFTNFSQNTPDPLAGPLWRPIEQLRADPNWRVYAAVITHDNKTLQTLLDSGDSPNGVSGFKGLPLTWACRLDDLEAIKILLKSGAEIDLYDPSDENALFAATRWLHIEIIRYLLAQGARVNARRNSNGETALYEALRNRSFDILTLLIQAGAEVNLYNKTGDTPLMIASLKNDLQMVDFLKSKGAKFNSPNEELLLAAANGDVATLQRILAEGDKARSHNWFYRIVFKHQLAAKNLLRIASMVNQSYEEGVTPLMAAAQYGQTAAVKVLIDAGADINAVDSINNTPLMYAIKSGHKYTVFALLNAGADPTLINLGGVTTLHQAAIYMDDPDLVYLLIRRGISVSAGDKISVTPLMDAACSGRIQTVKILLGAHVPINTQSTEGLTALMEASMSGHVEILTLLLGAGADLSTRDNKGRTALDWAIQLHRISAIAVLQKQSRLP